jgi:transposase
VFLTAVMGQPVNIKCCVKLGKTPTETYQMLQTVYGDEALCHSSVCEWFKRFKDGRGDLQDDPRNGRPSTSRNADTIANVREMAIRDPRLTLKMMSDELNINKKTIRQILHEDLRKRKTCAKFIPHSLTDEQKQRRLTSCQDFLQTCQDNLSFLDCILTGDESWVFQHAPETKRQNMQWTSKSSPRPKKFRSQESKIKTMLITLFDKQVVIHKGFVPEGPVHSAFYVEVIGRLLKRISRVGPQFRAEGSWFLLHDNALSRSALVVKIFLAEHGVVEISHPP